MSSAKRGSVSRRGVRLRGEGSGISGKEGMVAVMEWSEKWEEGPGQLERRGGGGGGFGACGEAGAEGAGGGGGPHGGG